VEKANLVGSSRSFHRYIQPNRFRNAGSRLFIARTMMTWLESLTPATACFHSLTMYRVTPQ